MAEKEKILILGGGFGGVKVALELAGQPAFSVTLISDQDNFRYYPMLYRTATGGSRVASEIPLSEILAGKEIKLVKDSAVSLDKVAKKVKGSSGKAYSYDALVVALGVVTNFFGIKGLDKYAYGIKTQEDSRRLREHLHKLLIEKQKPDINYVVIGGGPTGVELAGALPGYLRHVMKNHQLVDRRLHIDLVEAKNRLMPAMPKNYSLAVARRLQKLGVKLYLNQRVEAETADALMVGSHSIDSQTVVWTAGVTNHPFLKDNNFALSNRGKAQVDNYLKAAEHIYVIGDNADTKYSGMAQTALYDAVFVTKNLKRQADGKIMRSYRPQKPIYITPVGPHWAAVLWGRVHIYGWVGWVLRNAADFMAYRDLQPWWKAGKRWRATFENEETCPVCK